MTKNKLSGRERAELAEREADNEENAIAGGYLTVFFGLVVLVFIGIFHGEWGEIGMNLIRLIFGVFCTIGLIVSMIVLYNIGKRISIAITEHFDYRTKYLKMKKEKGV